MWRKRSVDRKSRAASSIDAALLALNIAGILACALASKSYALTIAAHSQTIVISLPTDSEIAALTTSDLTIQEFLAYKLEIEERIKREFPGVAVLVSNDDTIVAPDKTVMRARTHRFGFVIYAPGRATRVLDGVVSPDAFMSEAHNMFESRPAPIPKSHLSSPETTTKRAAPPPEPLPSYCGTWSGTVRQGLFHRYGVIMELRPGAEGAQVGTVDYPNLPCRGTLTLKRINQTEVWLEERIQSGPCESPGAIVLTTTGSRLGSWTWQDMKGRLRASATLVHIDLEVSPPTLSAQPPPAEKLQKHFVGTVKNVDAERETLVVVDDGNPSRTISAAAQPQATYRGFAGVIGNRLASIVGSEGLANVHVGDRIEVGGYREPDGAFSIDAVTLLRRAINTTVETQPKTGHGNCIGFRGDGTFVRSYSMTVDIYGVTANELLSMVVAARTLPYRIRIIGQNMTYRAVAATTDWVPGEDSPRAGQNYDVSFVISPASDRVRLSMKIVLQRGQSCSNASAEHLMCETLTKLAELAVR